MHLPGPLNAAVGFVATAAAEAKRLPDRAVELPMLAVSTALQMSLRAQQRYARLAARGDAVLNRRSISDEPPPWATFDTPLDDPSAPGALAAEVSGETAWDASPPAATQAAQLVQDLFGTDKPTLNGVEVGADAVAPPDRTPVETPADRPAARTAPRKRAAAKRTSGSAGTGKTVRKPRNTAPSRFDTVGDDAPENS